MLNKVRSTIIWFGFLFNLVRQTLVHAETLYHRDDALLHIAYVMLIWAAPIPADRWHCSLWP